jgi:hypothetical protein
MKAVSLLRRPVLDWVSRPNSRVMLHGCCRYPWLDRFGVPRWGNKREAAIWRAEDSGGLGGVIDLRSDLRAEMLGTNSETCFPIPG